MPFPSSQPTDALPVGKKSYHNCHHLASIQLSTVEQKHPDVQFRMAGKAILVSFDDFVKEFVPAPEGEMEPEDRYKSADFSAIPHREESHMYEPLTKAFNKDWLLPHDVAVSTPNKGLSDVASMQKINSGLYRRDDAPFDSTRWSSIELSIECKIEHTQQDPLDDSGVAPEAWSIKRRDVLGQVMCYAVLVFDNQQRTHHFTLLLLGPMARIMRWDRSGLSATNKFDYTKKPEYLAQFLWRFGRMTPEQRGHDPTAQRILPGSADYKLMHSRADMQTKARDGTVVGEHARQIFKDSLFVKSSSQDDSKPPVILGPAPLWRLTVHDSTGPRSFLVGLPHTTAGTLAGRGTRTYVAIDTSQAHGPFVYLKDAWRVAHQGIEQEGSILTLLNDNSNGGPVQGVPTLLCHGDVGNQVTRSQEVWQVKHPGTDPVDCPLKTHRHYRLVVKEVCLPLRDFRIFYELVGVICDCVETHGEAYKRKGLLHRDISAGNVLMYPKQVAVKGKIIEARVGILADWELAKRVGKPNTEDAPRQPDRTGTWQFTSAMALDNPKKRIVVQDDMESFLHLMLYYAIRFLPHNCRNVGKFMDEYFDGQLEEDGVYYGGEKKLNAMTGGKLTTHGTSLTFYKPTPPTPQDVSRERSLVRPESPIQSTTIRRDPHPINGVFVDFLARIEAHYKLFYTARPKKDPAPDDAPIDALDPSLLDIAEFVRSHHELEPDSAAEAAEAVPETPEAAISEEEKRRVEDLAAKLGDHAEMARLLRQHIQRAGWPVAYKDRIADQLPKRYKRNAETALGTKRTHGSAQLGTGESASKRTRSMR
ncbi:hypothetical protein PYCCODRAFT_1414665 [Trametes coccinea BRFM310]|uniref:Fungal-type protein kinase domain-containing protein n=1 Tax=Trametes coccinea (strain BRFM310) TaxID=1353009 RepID=A0A1Y2IJ43_TRAC3|nr:hypothetical protein PYCCODRAFT_1414665 [Trametes coccinea BRFM310]